MVTEVHIHGWKTKLRSVAEDFQNSHYAGWWLFSTLGVTETQENDSKISRPSSRDFNSLFFLYFNETKLKPETKKAIISRDYVYTFEENKTSISTNGSPYAQKHFRTRPVRPECHSPRVPSPTGLEHTGSCSPLFYVCTIGILWPIIGHVWC